MPVFLRALLAAVLLATFLGLCVYLYRRLVRDLTRRRSLRVGGAVGLALLFLSVPVARFAFPDVSTGVAAGIMSWWGMAIYTLLALLAVDLVRLLARLRRGSPAASSAPAAIGDRPVDPSRRQFLSRATAAGALTFGGGVSVFGLEEAFTPPEVTVLPLRLPGLPRALDGYTIVQLSDVHLGAVIRERFLDVLIREANAQKPDLVAITGDLVDGSPAQLGTLVARLKNLKSRHGTYFCSGNHEYYSGWERWAQALASLDLTVLRNRWVTIGDGGGSFDLIGVDDWGSHGLATGYDLDAATAGLSPERPSVLLAHQPVNLEAVSKKRIGLQLSGHTHGGQLFPGTLITDLIYGRHAVGLSKEGETWQFTSRGCGFVGPPMRVGSPPEVVKLVLLAS